MSPAWADGYQFRKPYVKHTEHLIKNIIHNISLTTCNSLTPIIFIIDNRGWFPCNTLERSPPFLGNWLKLVAFINKYASSPEPAHCFCYMLPTVFVASVIIEINELQWSSNFSCTRRSLSSFQCLLFEFWKQFCLILSYRPPKYIHWSYLFFQNFLCHTSCRWYFYSFLMLWPYSGPVTPFNISSVAIMMPRVTNQSIHLPQRQTFPSFNSSVIWHTVRGFCCSMFKSFKYWITSAWVSGLIPCYCTATHYSTALAELQWHFQ